MKHDGCFGRSHGWVVLNTHSHREQVALENLARQEFVAYCPMVRRRRSHARRYSDVLRPMFPGYVFVASHSCADRWRPLHSTMGVRSVLRCGDALSLLDDGFVESLKIREVDGAVCGSENALEVGQKVKLAGGPFDGLVATILGLHEHDRLTVLMELLNRPVRVRINAEQVGA